MIPHEPPRTPHPGFLYFPPFRVQGYSIAGEETVVQVPELDVCFDIGRCPRFALASPYVALTHGHMDHAAGLAYYFSQRHFQGMGVGTVLCSPALAEATRRMMEAWVDIEAQRTPFKVIPMTPGDDSGEFELKKGFHLRAFETMHTPSSLGYSIVEKRSKLKEEYAGLPQSKLVELKEAGEPITYIKEVPQVTFTGDTAPGSHFTRPEVTNARVLVTECTFLEAGHRDRARIGKHLHLSDIVKLLPNLEAEAVVITHLSRRTHLGQAKEQLQKAIPPEHLDRVFLLMDHRTNRARYERQLEAAKATQEA
jgi:ribonuclease Z